MESLSDTFSYGKAHLTFCTYDKSRPEGQRMTANIQIYIDIADWLELCRMLDCGELRTAVAAQNRSGSRDPIKEWLGGTSAKKLAKLGKPREDGKSLSRTAQLYAARNAGSVLFAASSGPGVENATGLIVPKFGKNPEHHVAVSMTLQDSSREQAAPATSARSRAERMPQQQASKQTPSKPTIQSPVAMF